MISETGRCTRASRAPTSHPRGVLCLWAAIVIGGLTLVEAALYARYWVRVATAAMTALQLPR